MEAKKILSSQADKHDYILTSNKTLLFDGPSFLRKATGHKSIKQLRRDQGSLIIFVLIFKSSTRQQLNKRMRTACMIRRRQRVSQHENETARCNTDKHNPCVY